MDNIIEISVLILFLRLSMYVNSMLILDIRKNNRFSTICSVASIVDVMSPCDIISTKYLSVISVSRVLNTFSASDECIRMPLHYKPRDTCI